MFVLVMFFPCVSPSGLKNLFFTRIALELLPSSKSSTFEIFSVMFEIEKKKVEAYLRNSVDVKIKKRRKKRKK